MIERILYRGDLPKLYELTPLCSDYLEPLEEPTVVPADLLDEFGATRDDAAFSLVHHDYESDVENMSEITYTLRLLRPKETREHLRPAVRHAIVEAFVDASHIRPMIENALSASMIMREAESTIQRGAN